MPTLDRQNGRAAPAHAAQRKSRTEKTRAAQENNFDTGNYTELAQDLSYPVKPDVDLLSWAALGQSVKPSRADSKQKRTWRREHA